MPDNPFGEVIFSYTCVDAVRDGTFVHPYPERFPWLLLTSSVHHAIERVIQGTDRTYDQATLPLLRDAVLLVVNGLKKDPDERLWTTGLEGNVTGQDIWAAINEKGGITLMFPDDY